MRLSRRSLYALRVLPYLVKAYPDSPLSVNSLSKMEMVPRKYLEQILTRLRKHDLLISERGREGGYKLSRAPEEISLGDIIRAVEGKLVPISCVHPSCPHSVESCWVDSLMVHVQDEISEVLDRRNLLDISATSIGCGPDVPNVEVSAY